MKQNDCTISAVLWECVEQKQLDTKTERASQLAVKLLSIFYIIGDVKISEISKKDFKLVFDDRCREVTIVTAVYDFALFERLLRYAYEHEIIAELPEVYYEMLGLYVGAGKTAADRAEVCSNWLRQT